MVKKTEGKEMGEIHVSGNRNAMVPTLATCPLTNPRCHSGQAPYASTPFLDGGRHWAPILLCFLLVILSSCGPKEKVVVNEGEFMDAFLRLNFHEWTSQDLTLVIKDKLRLGHFGKMDIEHREEGLVKFAGDDDDLVEAVRNLCKNNTEDHSLESIEAIDVRHEPMSEKTLKKMFGYKDESGWDIVPKIYPKSAAIISLSRPGISHDGSVGVIYMGVQSGGLCGHGGLYVLRKKKGKWYVAKYDRWWIS